MSNHNPITKAMITGAEEWIAFDRSDPFTRNRVYSHMKNGVATTHRGAPAHLDQYNYIDQDVKDRNGNGITMKQKRWYNPPNQSEPSFYSADRIMERAQSPSGEEYTKPNWINVRRP